MTELQLPPAMAALRPELGNLVAAIEQRAPYGSILLTARQGVQIMIDHREERVTERAHTAGAVLSAFDGVTLHEEAVSGFDRSAVARAAHTLVHDRSFADRSVDLGPPRTGDFSTALTPRSLQEKIDYCRDLQHRLRGLDERISADEVMANDDYLGGGYGVMGEAEREAISLFASLEGLLLDPVYTGRAAAGMKPIFRPIADSSAATLAGRWFMGRIAVGFPTLGVAEPTRERGVGPPGGHETREKTRARRSHPPSAGRRGWTVPAWQGKSIASCAAGAHGRAAPGYPHTRRELPRPLRVRLERERIEVRGHVARAARVMVVAPRPADAISALEDHEIPRPRGVQLDGHAEPGEPRPDDDRVEHVR